MIIPVPTFDEPEPVVAVEQTGPTDEWIRAYLNVASWKCPKCRLVNFGRNRRCAACKETK